MVLFTNKVNVFKKVSVHGYKLVNRPLIYANIISFSVFNILFINCYFLTINVFI